MVLLTLKSLFQNAAVVIALVVAFDLLTHNRVLAKSIPIKIVVGVLVGILGIAIMLTSYKADPGLIIDSRSVLLSVSGLYFGIIPTVIAMIITTVFRFVEGGESIWVGISVIISTGVFGLLVRHFWHKKLDKISIFQAFAFGLCAHIIMTLVIYSIIGHFSMYFFKYVTIPTLILFPTTTTILIFLLKYRIKRNNASKDLINLNERLNLALNSANLLFFDHDLMTNDISWSNWNNDILKQIIEKTNGNYEDFEQYVNDDDLVELKQLLFDAKKNKHNVNTNFRIYTHSDHEKWIHFSCQYFFDSIGVPNRVIGVVKDITQEKIIEQSLAEKELNLRTILDNAPDGIFVQTDGAFSFVNPTLLSMLRAKDENDLIGINCFTRIAPEYHDAVKERIKFQKETGNMVPLMEQEYLRMDGTRIMVETTASPFTYKSKDSYLVFVHDISRKKDSEAQIQKLYRAVEQSSASIVISDIKGNIEYVNPMFTKVTGYTYDDIIGKNPRLLKSGNTTTDEYKTLWKTISSGNVWSGVFLNLKKDGSKYWESATISPVKNTKNEITHYVAVKDDITEKRQIYEDLIIAKNKAEESNQLKSHFLANMSHEIRTPLNGILGFLDLLKDDTITVLERNEYLDIINKSGVRLLETINDIIEMSKIEAGYSKLDYELVDFIELLNDLYNFFKPQTDINGIQLIPNFKNIEIKFITDKNKLNGILTNLIKNAIKFTDSGSIQIGVEQLEHDILFTITDTGRGIPEDRLSAIFDRFIQADLSHTRGHEGSGLGLSISKAYVNLLGGKIWAESNLGKGSTFYFTIPQIENNVSIYESQNPLLDIEKSKHDFSILIAEDEEDNYQYLHIVLSKMGYTTIHANNGKEAINFLKNNPEISLILMDIKMPEMSGIEATQEIRKYNKTIPIIAQSAFLMTGYEEMINDNGFNDYLMKPIKRNQLEQILNKYL